MTTALMTSRRFAPLFWTQFLSAFNDNFLKNTLVFLILFQVSTGIDGAEGTPGLLITLAGAVFIAPFLFLSALGGELADRFDKATVSRRLKLAEIGGAFIALVGMALSSIPLMFAALIIFGVISALFGPVKYGILPDHLEAEDLAKANAWIEAATFLAILGGTIAGGLAFQAGGSNWMFGVVLMALACGCYLISRRIPETGSAAPTLRIDANIFRSTSHLLAELKQDKRLWRTALMAAWFWLVGAVVMAILPVIVKDYLGGDELAVTFYLAVFAIFIGIGSAIAAWLSAVRVVLLPAVIGTVLMGLFCIDLYFVLQLPLQLSLVDTHSGTLGQFLAKDNTIRVAVGLAGLALSGAFLAIPCFTALQSWAPAPRRARTIAGANALSAGFMAAGGVALAGILALGISVRGMLGVLGVLNLVVAPLMLKLLPTNPVRDLLTMIFRMFYRLEIVGRENLEKAGTAPILAPNHVSFLDAALAVTLLDEEPTFAIDHTIAQAWWVKPFLRFTNALPLDPTKPMATRTLIKVVKGGEPMVIFPEGRLTVTGSLMKVYDGAAMVADKTGSKIVPVHIDGLEKTPFSRLSNKHGKRRLFPKVRITILEPKTMELDPDFKGSNRRKSAGSALYNMMSDTQFEASMQDNHTVLERVVKTGKERGMRELAAEDPVTGTLSYGKLLAGVSVLARKFRPLLADQKHVGVMLPSANGAAVTLLAVMSVGKVPAMINFTSGPANILSACRASEVTSILTSRAFVKQAKLEAVIEAIEGKINLIWLDDLRKTVGFRDKLLGFLTKARPLVKVRHSDAAVILFTSGSEGTPKGVALTHSNILANAAQAAARIDFTPSDKVFNALPVFHSFGLTAGTILPLVCGVPVHFYPSPLHYRMIPEQIYSSNATIIFGTDTFLSGYARVAHSYDFHSIRYCFAGAEPVKPTTRSTYMDKFGVRILEGYGVTEASPVVALNTPMHNKPGTVGKLMPGIEARLEDVTGVEEGGRLFIKGPNIMAGYLLANEPGVLHPPIDGWHDTGDIVTIDEEGFITICGRAKRFAKIGGEMVSLAAVESLASELWPEHLSAVAAIRDDRKGEKLIMITDCPEASRKEFITHAKACGAQDLMIPSEVRFVDEIPILGSGKLDFAGVARLVKEQSETPAT
ncbi:MAG: acyl-[ACP]--phospholipid O-acyltransferase [Stappiaceae bacterium]